MEVRKNAKFLYSLRDRLDHDELIKLERAILMLSEEKCYINPHKVTKENYKYIGKIWKGWRNDRLYNLSRFCKHCELDESELEYFFESLDMEIFVHEVGEDPPELMKYIGYNCIKYKRNGLIDIREHLHYMLSSKKWKQSDDPIVSYLILLSSVVGPGLTKQLLLESSISFKNMSDTLKIFVINDKDLCKKYSEHERMEFMRFRLDL